MIAFVDGTVAAVGPDTAVVQVGGVGIAVMCTPGTLARLRPGGNARLATSLVVREDSLTLYGFADEDERTVFELLQTATGVGPRLAQAALSVLTADQVRLAVATEDVTTLCRIPGVGRKGAQRMVVELKDRLGRPTGAPVDLDLTAVGDLRRDQLVQALTGLGWGQRESEAAAQSALAHAGPDDDVALLLRNALRGMQRA